LLRKVEDQREEGSKSSRDWAFKNIGRLNLENLTVRAALKNLLGFHRVKREGPSCKGLDVLLSQAGRKNVVGKKGKRGGAGEQEERVAITLRQEDQIRVHFVAGRCKNKREIDRSKPRKGGDSVLRGEIPLTNVLGGGKSEWIAIRRNKIAEGGKQSES